MPDLLRWAGRRSTNNPDRPFAKGRRWLQATVLALLALGCGAEATHGAAPATEVYVISNGWHTEIGLPAALLGGPLAAVRRDFPGAAYVAFGWGERAFYMSPSPTWTEALRALLPARAVLLVLALGTVPSRAFVAGIRVTALPLRPAGERELAAFLWRSFAQTKAGEPDRLGPGPYPASAFYAATGTYDGGHTCNTWTAEALSEAGLPVRTAGVIFAGQVMRQVRALRADPTVPSPSRQGAGAMPDQAQ